MITVRLKEQKGSDHIFAAELDSEEVGTFQVRLSPLAHGLEVKKCLLSRRIAEALVNYAKGYVRACGYDEAVIIVESDNTHMHAFLSTQPVVCDPSVDVYTIGLK